MVIAGLLLLGLIGLVLPIIPGLLFLFLAVLLLTRISTRFNALASGQWWFRHLRRRWHKLNLRKVSDRVKLGFWYCAGAAVRGVEAGTRFVQKLIKFR